MELVYPRQLNPGPIVGRWQPSGALETLLYRVWAGLGVLAVAVGYPLLLAGFAIRFYAARLDSAGTRLGILGVILVSLLAWGGLTAAAWLRDFTVDGLLAVGAAGLVATVAAGIAVVASRVGGRASSVLVAYPAGMTALFLPPVVAALYSPALAGIVFPPSQSLAIWLLDSVLAVAGIGELLRARFALEGVAYVLMWLAIAVPLGWVLGALAGLADVVRPRDRAGRRGRQRSSEMF